MSYVLDFNTFSTIFDNLKANGKLQIQKKGASTWIDVINFDISSNHPHLTILIGGKVTAIDISEIQSIQCVS